MGFLTREDDPRAQGREGCSNLSCTAQQAAVQLLSRMKTGNAGMPSALSTQPVPGPFLLLARDPVAHVVPRARPAGCGFLRRTWLPRAVHELPVPPRVWCDKQRKPAAELTGNHREQIFSFNNILPNENRIEKINFKSANEIKIGFSSVNRTWLSFLLNWSSFFSCYSLGFGVSGFLPFFL